MSEELEGMPELPKVVSPASNEFASTGGNDPYLITEMTKVDSFQMRSNEFNFEEIKKSETYV